MSFFDKLADFASTIAETGREAHHTMGLDKVGLGNEMYVEDDSTNEVMVKVNARRAGTAELLTAAKDVRSSAYDSIRYNKRLYDCLDAVKKCVEPPPAPSITSTMNFEMPSWGSDTNKPISIAFLYEDLVKDVEESYKSSVRPLKEEYKKHKLSYLYNKTQLTERRFKEGTEDAKTRQYEESMKSAEMSWKEIALRLRAAAQEWLTATDQMLVNTAGKASVISSHYALTQAVSALSAAQLVGVQVGEPGLIEKSNAALLELTSKAQEMNLQIHFT